MPELEIRVTGKTGEVDGYVEIILGVLFMSGLLLKKTLSNRTRPNGKTQIYIDAHVPAAPLGHLGESDIPERKDDPADG